MTANAFAISRRLVDKGLEKAAADAVAEEIVAYSDEHLATKADIAELKGEMKALAAEMRVQLKLLMGLVGGLYIGIALLFMDRLAG